MGFGWLGYQYPEVVTQACSMPVPQCRPAAALNTTAADAAHFMIAHLLLVAENSLHRIRVQLMHRHVYTYHPNCSAYGFHERLPVT